MGKSITVEPKKRGRPSKGGREPLVGLRLSPEMIAKIDRWTLKTAAPSRSEAIRNLIERGLKAKR